MTSPSLYEQALTAARVDTFSRSACEQLLGLYGTAQGQERARIGRLFESQFALAELDDAAWLHQRIDVVASGRGDAAEEEAPEDAGEIDWDNVAAETRIMLDLNRSAAQAREQQGEQA